MTASAARLAAFAARHRPLVAVEVAEAKGSTPRETGAFMLVAPDAIFGTIGGGRLEFEAIDAARRLIEAGEETARTDVALGPQIGQCCGGHVTLGFRRLDAALLADFERRAAESDAADPHVYVFGAGHVGRALARAFSALPVNATIVETRPQMLEGLEAGAVTAKATAIPEALVEAAPAASAFLVLTHDHALDFLIVDAALARADAAYVGMIGSKTKRATYAAHNRRQGRDPALLDRLVCPIGAGIDDKRPEVIAAMVAAEVLKAVLVRDT